MGIAVPSTTGNSRHWMAQPMSTATTANHRATGTMKDTATAATAAGTTIAPT